MRLYLNGALLDAERARIDPLDRGFTLGDGLFETMRARAGAALRLDAHWARLRAGAEVLGLALPLDKAHLARMADAVLAANGLADSEAVLRLTVTRGPGARGILPPETPQPTVMMTAGPAPGPPGPAQAVIARSTRRNEHSPLSRCKSLNYLDNIIARQEASAREADDALLLNTAGRLAESTVSTLFVVVDGACLTPPLSEGALAGVARAALLAEGLAREAPITPDMPGRAAEAFLTNSLGARALVAVDGQPIADGAPGPVTAKAIRILDEAKSG